MPFLRPVAPSSDHGDAAIELKSSKTLIGAGASTCDVVLPGVNGVLEVHALLSLSPTKSSGSLVPFSTAAGGSCFLNGQQIPQDGVRVVHGDRLAFGVGPDANEFIFELTGKRSTGNSSSTLRRSSTRDFRKALDALRGDRESSQRQRMARDLSAASLASVSPDKARKRTGVGQSREEQFSKLLADASSDSALSDYVERKLRERQLKSTTSITDSELNGGRAMMEPPPSLLSSMSESMGSRAGTSFKDSILERSVDALKDKSLTSTSAFTSTAEKNYAEIEKLRLSQRMRQVNRVLNGSMTFGDSYMATDSAVNASRGHDIDDHVLARSPNLTSITRDQPRQSSRSMQQASAEEEEEHSDNEEDDELPAMSEKPTLPTAFSPQHVSATELQELSDRNYQVQDQHQEHEEVDQEESLADSLPGFSEPIRATPPKSPQQNTHSFRASTVTAKATPSGSPLKIDAAAAVPPTKTRTALHQKLIDQAISQRQLDTLAQGFVRWKRGLRIQTQRRLHKAQQLRKLSDRLGILRRNRAFSEWQSLASIQSQIVSCRIEAFQSRSGSRLVYSAFTRWIRATLIGDRAKRVMHAVLSRALLRHIGKSFRAWRENSLFVGQASSEDRLRLYYDVHIESRLNHSAAKHCSRVEQEKLRRVLRGWFQAAKEELRMATRLVHAARCHFERTCRERLHRHLKGWQSVTSKQSRKLSILSRLIRRQAGGHLRRALAIWKVGCLLRRSEQSLQHQAEKLKAKADLELEELDKEHQSAKRDIEGELTRQLDELKGKLQQKETALIEAQSRIEERRQQKMHALEEWTHDLEDFYEKSITNCDAQIEEASAQLEQLLQISDSNVVAARFRASQYLVATMTEQKVSQANARAALQEAFIASLSKGRSSLLEDMEDDVQVSKGVQILQSLLQQRVTRRLQLHRSIARVAAAAPPSKATANSQPVDATRLKHASFLAGAVAEREAQHAAAMTRLLLRVRRAHPPPAAQY